MSEYTNDWLPTNIPGIQAWFDIINESPCVDKSGFNSIGNESNKNASYTIYIVKEESPIIDNSENVEKLSEIHENQEKQEIQENQELQIINNDRQEIQEGFF